MGTGRSEVNFTNSTQTMIYVAYMRLDYGCQSDCPDDPWDVLGWIALSPGETKIRANETKNRWFYYYAEDANGRVYGGDYVAEVKEDRFEKCTCVGVVVTNGASTNPYHDVGFDVLDTQTYSGVNFV
jgi:uncharacterized membrane protein